MAVCAGAAVFAAAAYPCQWAHIYILRELLRGAGAIGLMDTARGLGGLGKRVSDTPLPPLAAAPARS